MFLNGLKRLFIVLAILTCCLGTANAATRGFRVAHIQVQGLKGLPLGTVLSYLPVRVGQTITDGDASSILKTLYATGFFNTVEVDRKGNTLIIRVSERSTIALVHVNGNKSIPKKKLNAALSKAGIKAGQVYNKATLSSIVEALREQYYSLGHYAAHVALVVTKASRNRVMVQVNIKEGPVAKIKSIVIVGNHAFKEATLLHEFKLSTPTIMSFITHNDSYSQQKLDASIEALTSYYLNRGYLHFLVIAKQVSISADRMGIYITIKISEGPVYHVSGFRLAGKFAGFKQQIQPLVGIKAGDVFSREKLIAAQSAVYQFFGTKGYAYPSLNPVPQINDIKHTVFLVLNVNPGQLIYVRRINFIGNSLTSEDVLRRQMRQTEDSLYNLTNINESKRLLANLPYLTNIQVQPKPVLGHSDQIDLQVSSTEQRAGRATLTGGYSGMNGFFYGVGATEPNLMGTGKLLGFNFQRSVYQTSYGLQYNNPFYSKWGVSRGFDFNYVKTRPNKVNLSNYSYDTLKSNVNFSIPLSEYVYANASVGYAYTHLFRTGDVAQIKDFLNQHGSDFYQGVLSAGLSRSTFDRYLFPTSGSSQSLTFNFNAPLTHKSLTYYSVAYNGIWYHPLFKGLIFSLGTTVAYGGSLGKHSEYPFYNNFYAGGLGSVAGYASSSLGPKDSQGDPIGGNIQTIAQANLIIPSHFSQRVRFSLGLNVGNVYHNHVNFGQLRYSVGPVVNWLAPMLGNIRFGLAWPLFHHKGDDTQVFGFGAGVGI